MLQAFSTPALRAYTFRILALSLVFALAAMIVGIADNPLGILLLFIAAIAFGIAFVHPWQTPRRYLYLLCASLLATILSVLLHNLLEVLAGNAGHSGLTGALLAFVSGVFFFIALVLGPALVMIGVVGALLRWIERL